MKIIFLLLFSFTALVAQSRLDSLDQKIIMADGKERIDLLNEAAFILSKDSTSKAILYSKYAVEAATEIKYISGEALACLNAANSFRNINKFSDAIDYYKNAFELYSSIGGKQEAAFSLKSIAEIYTRLAAFDKALDYSLKALNIYQELQNEVLISETLSLIGQIYYSTGNYNKSLEYFNTSFDIAKSIGSTDYIISGLNWLALIYDQHKNEYENALEIYNEALEISDTSGIKFEKAGILTNMGKLYLKRKNYEKASDYFNSALIIYEELNYSKGTAENLLALADLCIESQKYEDAGNKLNQALQIARKDSFKLLIVQNNLLRSKLFKAMGNYEQALKYFTGFTSAKDSLFSLEKSRQLTEIQTIHDTEKKEKLIEIQALKLLEQQRKINLYLTIAVIIAFASIIIYILYRNYKHIAKFLRTVINSLTHPFYVIRTNDFQIELANTKAASTSFLSSRQNKGSSIEKGLTEDEKNWLINKVVESKSPYTAEQKYKSDNGEDTYYEIQGYPIFDKKGNVVKMIEYSIDVTSRKTAEEALRESEQKLRELNATKDKFFSIIAHDLKNPFSVILGYSEMLKEDFDEIPEEEKFKYISLIGGTAQHSYNLLEDLLNWARSQTGILEVIKESINVLNLAKETADLNSGAAESKKIDIKISVPENMVLDTDRFMLSTTLRNLLNNAIKFTDKGGTVSLEAHINENNITFSISDTGIGLTNEDIKKLFRIDVNNNSIGNSTNKGTGLGLILCKEFVEKLGGRIWAESELGKGSSFKFTIPLK